MAINVPIVEKIRVNNGFYGGNEEFENKEFFRFCPFCGAKCWIPKKVKISYLSNIYVISNALVLRGLYHDMKIVVDSNSCAGVTPEKHKAALEVMKSCQIEVI